MRFITDTMTRHHRDCDRAFRRADEALARPDWAAVEREAGRFLREMARHIDLEEDVLFPAFEQATGMTRGPTGVMRMEHARMREAFAQMRAAIAVQDAPKYRDASAGLIALLQQHNLREEGILYPMLDRSLGDKTRSLVEKVEALLA
ncbi:MAG TPA: hemerythrin domain-containing protein [Casimicrobiaceae bacterium]|nr:hemerythrin domain-containing protein [Casimicrobiaceae bacterium]